MSPATTPVLTPNALSRCPVPEEIEEASTPIDVPLFDAFPGAPHPACYFPETQRKAPVPSQFYSGLEAGTVQSLSGDDNFGPCVLRVSWAQYVTGLQHLGRPYRRSCRLSRMGYDG